MEGNGKSPEATSQPDAPRVDIYTRETVPEVMKLRFRVPPLHRPPRRRTDGRRHRSRPFTRLLWILVAGAALGGAWTVYRHTQRRTFVSPTRGATSNPSAPAEHRSLAWLMELPHRIRTALEEADRLAARNLMDQALDHLERIAQTAPLNLEVKRALAEFYGRHQRWAEARRIISELIEAQPQDLALRYRLAEICLQQGELGDAYRAIQWYLSVLPDDGPGQKLAARICLHLGRAEDAVHHLRILQEGRKDDVESKQMRALAYLRLGQYTRAINWFHELIRERPDDASNYYNLAIAYARQQQASESLEVLVRAVQVFGPASVSQWMGEKDFEPLREDRAFNLFRNQLINQQPPELVSLRTRPPEPSLQNIGWMPEPVAGQLPTLKPR